MTMDELAAYLKISNATRYRPAQDNELPGQKIGKRWRFHEDAILARTLCDEAYDRNPGLRQFIDRTGIALRPHAEFKKADLEDRQALYIELAKRVWDPALIRAELEASRTETVGR